MNKLAALFGGTILGYTGTLWYKHTYLQSQQETENQTNVPPKQQIPTRAQEVLKYGPACEDQENLRYKENYVASLNFKTKAPNWVAEHITHQNMQGEGNRNNINFEADETVDSRFRATNEDYFNSGYSRGHMTPASNNKRSMTAMKETFILNSNIVPQDFQNNSLYWHRLELFARGLVNQFANVYIVTGPLYLPEQSQQQLQVEEKGKKPAIVHPTVKYQVIGKNHVAVPTHLFKLILTENAQDGTTAAAGFVIPNKKIPEDDHLTKYQVPIREVEHYGGFIAYPKVNAENLADLCKVTGCNMISARDHRGMSLERDLESSRSLWFLEKTWKALQDEGYTVTEKMKQVYESRKSILQK